MPPYSEMTEAEARRSIAEHSGVIRSTAYRDGRRVGDVAIEGIAEALRRPGEFVWIGLYEPSEELLGRVQDGFGFHELAVEDAHCAHQRPKVERYEDSLFLVLRTAQMSGEPPHLELGETHVFLGGNYIVTVRHGSLKSHVGLRTRCEQDPDTLALGPGFVLHTLVDFVIEQYFPILDRLETEVEGLEERIFEGRPKRETSEQVYDRMRELLLLKRAVGPLIDVCNRLQSLDSPALPETTRPYFRDAADNAGRIFERIENQRELLASALQAHLSLVTLDQTEATKKLAAWAAIIAVPTAVAGIYGMNFANMPELTWSVGYPFAILMMAAGCSGLWLHFRRTGWL